MKINDRLEPCRAHRVPALSHQAIPDIAPKHRDQTGSTFQHDTLQQFWLRSQGIWFSKLAKVVVKLLDSKELIPICQLHQLDQVEFGIRMSWEYYTQQGADQMLWCVSSQQPNLIFTDKIPGEDRPQVLHYQMSNPNHLVMSVRAFEETIVLENDARRSRELRHAGKLARRLWEHKFNP